MIGILLSYNNQTIVSSQTLWSDKLFGKSEHQLNHYYMQVSKNSFEFTKAIESSGIINDGIATITLNKNHPSSSDLSSIYPDLKDALIALDTSVDFSLYDSDANGHITPDELILTFIIAGYEDAYEGRHVYNGIWAHQYCMLSMSNTPILDGVSIMACQNGGNFALFGERHDKQDSHDATIGIIAHELGHSAFSLPDLYNTIDSDSGGIGYFGLMGLGTWATQNDFEYAGNTPTHFSAWSKIYNGWVNPKEQTGYITLSESASLDYDILKIPINSWSYYLLENRNNSGYDKGLFSLSGNFNGGIALWKIDESKLTPQNFENNSVNADTNNKGVDLVEASSSSIDAFGSNGDEDALYYTPHVSSFTTLVQNISQRGSIMSLNVN
jgi:M6 family metalloprotease-like protein